MSLTRRQRALEKLNAVKARNRLPAQSAHARAGIQLGEKSHDVSEVQAGDSKLDNTEDVVEPHLLVGDENGKTFPHSLTDSPIGCRTDDDEEMVRNVATDSPVASCSDDDQEPTQGIFMPTHDGGESPVVVDTREDSVDRRRNKHYKGLSQDSSQGAQDKSMDSQKASEVKINSTDINKASPLRRFDIVEGSFGQKAQQTNRSMKGAHKKSSKARLSEKHKRSRKTRRDHGREDDTWSFDSQLDTWLNEGKGNPLASALDRVFDYFDEMRSVGDESYSIRTEKTEETVPVAPRRSAGSLFADVEGMFTEGFSCGTLVATCESLTAPSYSFHEDESTLSGTKGSKEALDSNASLDRVPKKLEGDSRSERSSILPEAAMYTSKIALSETKRPNETKSLELGQSVAGRNSLDNQYGEACRDMCFVAVDCINETPHGIADASSPIKLQQLVQEATDQAANIRNNINSDMIFDIGQHSLDTYNTTPFELTEPETGSQNILMAGESVSPTAEKQWSLTFLSAESHATETVTFETQAVAESQENESYTGSNQHRDSKSEGDDEDEDKGLAGKNNLYAEGQSIKPSASFFSLDAHVKTKADTPTTAFQEAVAKLREIQSTPVTDRIREIGDHVKDVLTCTADVNPQDTSAIDLPTNGQTISISMEDLQNMCSCSECHAQGTETAMQENNGHNDVDQEANGDSTQGLVTISMDMANPWANTDQTRTRRDQPEWKVLQDWHDSVPTERYSADAIAGIVCDDENAEPEIAASSTISTMGGSTIGGISSKPTVSTHGFFEDVPTEPLVKPRRKWEPISKKPSGSLVRHSIDVKELGNRVLAKSTKLSSVTLGHGVNDENAPNRKSVIPTAQGMSEQSGMQNRGRLNTCHPFVSTKAKREAWRNTQADDFVDIMSANARADDWKQIVAER